jgi:hypothetical protein
MVDEAAHGPASYSDHSSSLSVISHSSPNSSLPTRSHASSYEMIPPVSSKTGTSASGRSDGRRPKTNAEVGLIGLRSLSAPMDLISARGGRYMKNAPNPKERTVLSSLRPYGNSDCSNDVNSHCAGICQHISPAMRPRCNGLKSWYDSEAQVVHS